MLGPFKQSVRKKTTFFAEFLAVTLDATKSYTDYLEYCITARNKPHRSTLDECRANHSLVSYLRESYYKARNEEGELSQRTTQKLMTSLARES